MIRTLLTTSALALVLSTSVIAQDATTTSADPNAPATETMAPADPAAPADAATPADAMAPADATTTEPAAPADAMAPADTTTAPATTDARPMDTTMDAAAPFDMSAGYMAADDDALVSRIMGSSIFSSGAEDAETIGTVNDLVLGADGRIHAVVIGVGGFLGIGEKNVAVDFASLEHTVAFDQSERWVLATTAEALTAAPDFVWPEDAPVADPAMAPADGMAPADPAMAPAAPVTN